LSINPQEEVLVQDQDSHLLFLHFELLQDSEENHDDDDMMMMVICFSRQKKKSTFINFVGNAETNLSETNRP